MISYIKGTLAQRAEGFIILETGGIGYQILVSAATLAKLPQTGEPVQVFTYFSVKEDGVALYGFATAQEQEMFHQLLRVSGVGPKGALGFLAQLSPAEIVMAILSEDVKTLSKAPGVGKKTAQRVILELKDTYKMADILPESVAEQTETAADAKWEAMDALLALGYSRSEAARAVNQAAQPDMTTEEILKAALKKMMTL